MVCVATQAAVPAAQPQTELPPTAKRVEKPSELLECGHWRKSVSRAKLPSSAMQEQPHVPPKAIDGTEAIINEFLAIVGLLR